MFLEAVVPDHSLDLSGFTYFVPEHLHGAIRRGCVVEVPFGDELEAAIVTGIDTPPPERAEAKAVASVIVPAPIVHPYQIDVALAIARRYFVQFHTALSLFLPTPVLRRFLKTGTGYPEFDIEPNTEIPTDPGSFGQLRPTLLYDRVAKGVSQLFGTAIPALPGTALILPSDSAVDRFLRETPIGSENFLVHTDSLTEAKDFRLRISAASRERPFLVWTRKLCSYNLAAYPHLAYAEDPLFPETRHKYFHAYDNVTILEAMRRAYPFSLTVSSAVPSVRLMALAAKGEWTLQNE